MRISETQLREILRHILLEGRGILGVESPLDRSDDDDDDSALDFDYADLPDDGEDYGTGLLDLDAVALSQDAQREECRGVGKQKVVFASRQIVPFIDAHHAWIILYDENGVATSLSGKAGMAFTFMRFVERLGIGRDDDADEAYFKIKKKWDDGEIDDFDDWQEVLDQMQWRSLTKWENWNSDTPGAAEYQIVLPLPERVCMDEFQGRIRAAFDAYNDDLPYDPIPAFSRNPADRNSNSFAFSLARAGYGGHLPPNLKTNKRKWPGSTLRILPMIQAWSHWSEEDRPRGDSHAGSQLSPGSQETKRQHHSRPIDGNRIGRQQPTSESLSRNSLKNIILEVMREGEVVDLEKYRQSQQPEPDQEWFDLFDEEELQKYKTRGRLRRQTIEDPEREATEDETFEEYLQGIESGKVVDMFQDDDPMSEVKSDGAAYTGTLGTAQQVPTADDAGAAADKCQIDRDEIENVTNQYNTEEDQQQKKAYQDQLRVLTQNHNKSKSQGGCGP